MTSPVTFKFRLYIDASTQNSAEAMANLLAICHRYLANHHEIEVVDIEREPQRALADGINMTPSLIKLAPGPVRKVVGTLAHTKWALMSLEVAEAQRAAVEGGEALSYTEH
jgi:circadian clock protein KaiB